MEKKKTKTFQDLIVWEKSHSFVLHVYSFSRQFPKKETFGLTSQFRRAAVSIAANIAEGFKKNPVKIKSVFTTLLKGLLRNAGII